VGSTPTGGTQKDWIKGLQLLRLERFGPYSRQTYLSVAQWIERHFPKVGVGGPIPSRETRTTRPTVESTGSNPVQCRFESDVVHAMLSWCNGSHAGLRNQCLRAYRFESDREHVQYGPLIQLVEILVSETRQ
jgi:hypothetical protein